MAELYTYQVPMSMARDVPPQTEDSIARAKAYNAEQKRDIQKQRDKLDMLRMVDTYGVDELELWIRNIKADLTGSRVSPGTAGDPRR